MPDPRAALAVLQESLPIPGLLFCLRQGAPDWQVVRLAGDAGRVTGFKDWDATEAPGRWLERLHHNDRERVLGCLEDLPADGLTLDYRFLAPGGSIRWIREEVRSTPPGDPLGPDSTISTLRDITLERTLRTRVTELEEQARRSQRIDSLGHLTSGVAHDFNNLLTTVMSATHMIAEDEALPRDLHDDAAAIRDAALRGRRLVRQLLRFAGRRGEPQMRAVDLADMLQDLRGILERTVGERVTFEFVAEEGLPLVHCDPARLEQVVLNLAVNARDAMPDGGVLRIALERVELEQAHQVEAQVLRPGAFVVLAVSDTGHGIPEGARDRIFEPFFTTRAESSHDSSSGTGFGLSTVQRIVRGHGGGIEVDTDVGTGTTFRVYLPIREVEERAPATVPEMDSPIPTDPSGYRILVVEDEPAVRSVVARTLTRGGHRTVAVASAEEAIQVFGRAQPRFDLLLTDVVLPDRSGPELVTALHRRVNRPLPVIYVSGYSEEQVALRGGGEKGEIFLAKPFTPEELCEAVGRALEWAQQMSGEADGRSDAV